MRRWRLFSCKLRPNFYGDSYTFLKRHSDRWDWEKKQSYLDCVQTAVEQIDQFLDDVLLIGKVEAGKLRFDPEPLDLHQLCCDLVTQMQLLSHRSQHRIAFVSRGNCKTPFVDRKLLRPILTNLLDNAIKYSPPGSTVNLELTCQDDNLIFHIKDAGIGIPATDRQKLFEPFHRGSNVGEVSGTGLGLTVVKKLVDLQGGQITVATEIGSGTTFTIALPLLKEKESEDRIQNNSTNELLGLQ